MSVTIMNAGSLPNQAAGSQYLMVVNKDGSINVATSGANIGIGSVFDLGLSNFEIIHKNSGSPAVAYTFSNYANSFLIQNLGSAPVYYTFNATANPASSGTAFLQGNDGISFNLQIGSISIQSSGATASDVQCIRLS